MGEVYFREMVGWRRYIGIVKDIREGVLGKTTLQVPARRAAGARQGRRAAWPGEGVGTGESCVTQGAPCSCSLLSVDTASSHSECKGRRHRRGEGGEYMGRDNFRGKRG